jgi:hypothetical protein
MMGVTAHMMGPGIPETEAQEYTRAVLVAVLEAARSMAADAGEDAVLGGLLSAYVHFADESGRHADAIKGMELALIHLRTPDMIRFAAKGRA